MLQIPIPTDPTPFSVWGISGLLGFVCIVTVLVLLNIFLRQTKYLELKDKLFTESISDVAEKVERSHDRMSQAFIRQSKALDKVLMYFESERQRTSGPNSNLDDTQLRLKVRSVLKELDEEKGNQNSQGNNYTNTNSQK